MKQTLQFTKMHGLGNDVLIINTLSSITSLSNDTIKKLADRHFGIGFDQLLLIEPAKHKQADFFCRIYNADGTEAEQCGNGLRCVACYLYDEGLHTGSLTLETSAGIFPIIKQSNDLIQVSMGLPHIQNALIDLPLTANTHIPISVINMGNPHAIHKVDQLDSIPSSLCISIANHASFPNGVNVGLIQVMDKHHLRIKTIERGVGETLACGSNACAAVVASIINHWCDSPVNVAFQHGSLSINWEGENKPIQMTGPATRIFSGEVILNDGN